MSQYTHNPLIEALRQPRCYDHAVSDIRVVETHISWILLTGPYAYKIKKPVDLGFLDFSTLEKRRFFCGEELRLNRRLAPQLYLDVCPVTGDAAQPVMGGDGKPIEYALKMVQFDPAQQLDHLLANNALRGEHMDRIAAILAHFHDNAAVAPPDSAYGEPATVWQPVEENFTHIGEMTGDLRRLHALRTWCETRWRDLRKLFAQRKSGGRVRECHGDLHLANIALYQQDIVIFDCLEFNDRLRWIDVINDAAFLVMDLDSRGQRPLAFRFLNAYLQHRGDYAALPLLRYYLVYRAMVRAKVACIRLGQVDLDADERRNEEKLFENYLTLAEDYSQSTSPALIITHGLSGSGKSTISEGVTEQLGAIRVRSDVERKRLHGLDEEARSQSGLNADLYSRKASDATYERLATLAGPIIGGGYSAIIDATFLSRRRRDAFRRLAGELGAPFLILDCHAPAPLLRQWIEERARAGGDPSEADPALLESQMAHQDELAEDERPFVIDVDTSRELDVKALAALITTGSAGAPL